MATNENQTGNANQNPDPDAPARAPKGTAANTTGGAPTGTGANAPAQTTRTTRAGATPGQTEESDQARQARHDQENADAQHKQARRRSHLEGLAVAHDNHLKEIDALISQLGQGNPVTTTQLTALKNAAKGMHATASGIASGTIDAQADANQPGSAGRQAPPPSEAQGEPQGFFGR